MGVQAGVVEGAIGRLHAYQRCARGCLPSHSCLRNSLRAAVQGPLWLERQHRAPHVALVAMKGNPEQDDGASAASDVLLRCA